MINTLIISNIILWLLVLVLVAVIFALVRQVGVLYERVQPAGALMSGKGLKTGEQAPVFDLLTLAGDKLQIGGERSNGKSTLLFFLSPTCPVCKTLLPVLQAMRKSEAEWLEIILASDGDEAEHRNWLKQQKLESWPYVLSPQLGMTMQVAKLPFAALIGRQRFVKNLHQRPDAMHDIDAFQRIQGRDLAMHRRLTVAKLKHIAQHRNLAAF